MFTYLTLALTRCANACRTSGARRVWRGHTLHAADSAGELKSEAIDPALAASTTSASCLLQYNADVLKCPHCGRAIADQLVVAAAGRIGGRKTAMRGPEHFRWLQSKRKHRRGGRPPKHN